MTNQLEAASRVISDVLSTTLSAPWTRDGELEPQARSIARQLERIHSSRDAELTLRRALASSFGDAALPEQELVLAGRLLWLRLSAEGLVKGTPDVEGYSADEVLDLVTTESSRDCLLRQPDCFPSWFCAGFGNLPALA